MTRLAWLSSLFALALAPALAHAADGYVTASVNLRAGPDIGYPRIATIPVGYDIRIYGCTAGWGWCDVGWRGDRGWIVGSYIEFYDDGGYQPLPAYGARVGIPIVTFTIALYWSSHYRHRAFYRQRDDWYARPIPHRPPPPPPPRPWHRPRPNVPSPGGHRPPPHGSGLRPAPQPRPTPESRPTARPLPSTRPAPRPESRPTPHPAPATRPAPQREQHQGRPTDRGRGKPTDRKRDDDGGH